MAAAGRRKRQIREHQQQQGEEARHQWRQNHPQQVEKNRQRAQLMVNAFRQRH